MTDNPDEPDSSLASSDWSLDSIDNIGHCLSKTAAILPNGIAVACPKNRQPKKRKPNRPLEYDTISYRNLESASNQIALGILQSGFQPGQRLALMVPPGIQFVTHVFALFKAGAVIILIDPGMGRKNLIQCLSAANPTGMVGIPLAHLARTLFRKRFPDCRSNFVVDGFFPGCAPCSAFMQLDEQAMKPLASNREDEAAVIFTSGSTGSPKGVLYRHRNFIEQAQQIRDYFGIEPGTTDVSGFPLFALFNIAMGVTTVFPQMDATRPADVYPPNIIDAVNRFEADQSFGSPALWNTVSNYCIQNSVTLPTMKRILSAGAPVPATVLRRIRKIIAPDGDAFTPYGATEALPVACNSATVVLNETAAASDAGKGTCVGNRFPHIRWKLIEISDQPISSIDFVNEVEVGQIGELIVQGPVVTDQYVTRTEANAEHKIVDGESFWHRMGDIGYFDSQDRFWFCGRKTHRVLTADGTMYTIPCEAIINTHEKIYRSALVGVGTPGQQTPVIIAEPHSQFWKSNSSQQKTLLDELRLLAEAHSPTEPICHFLLHRSLPVDIRHNAKIFREKLRDWATPRINKE